MANENADGVNPTIVVPGIKGSTLMNSYPMTPTTTWNTWQAVAGTPLESIQLDALGQVDFGDQVLNRAVDLLHPAYEKLVSGLRGRLKSPVYTFPYDWRLSCKTNAQRLVAFVKGIQAKPMTSLPGWSKGKRLVNLVCHSMGGLVARSFLAQWSEGTPPVDALVFIATPHRGSLDAVAAIITGDTPVLDFEKHLRKLARAMPSVYELLPHDWDDAPVVLGNKPLDLFQVANWQSNVVEETDGLEDLTQARLTAAADFFASLPSADAMRALAKRMLCLAGNKPQSTLGRVTVLPTVKDGAGTVRNWFLFGADATLGPSPVHVDGDQVVTVKSATLPNTPLTVVPYSDAGWWPSEVGARLVNFHAFICGLDEVQTMVAGFLTGTSTDNVPLGLRTWTAG